MKKIITLLLALACTFAVACLGVGCMYDGTYVSSSLEDSYSTEDVSEESSLEQDSEEISEENASEESFENSSGGRIEFPIIPQK